MGSGINLERFFQFPKPQFHHLQVYLFRIISTNFLLICRCKKTEIFSAKDSVTRFGEISPLWQKKNYLVHLLMVYLVPIWLHFGPTLANIFTFW